MPITTTSSMQKGGSLSTKKRCWECNEPSDAFIFLPTSGNPVCANCAADYGLEIPVSPSDAPIGTIRYPDGRTEMREDDGDEA